MRQRRFNTYVSLEGIPVDNVTEGLLHMTEDYLPRDCAKNTHRYLNQVTKGQGMTIEEFITRVKVIKSYLPLIPMPMNDALTEDQLCALV